MRPRVTVKIIASENKYAIKPSRRHFAVPARLFERAHQLPPFMELARPDYGLAAHDHLATNTLSVRSRQDAG